MMMNARITPHTHTRTYTHTQKRCARTIARQVDVTAGLEILVPQLQLAVIPDGGEATINLANHTHDLVLWTTSADKRWGVWH